MELSNSFLIVSQKKPPALSGLGPKIFPKKPALKKFLIFSQIYSSVWKTETLELEAYSEPDILRTMAYLEPEAYSEHCQTSTMESFAKHSYLAHLL